VPVSLKLRHLVWIAVAATIGLVVAVVVYTAAAMLKSARKPGNQHATNATAKGSTDG